MRERWTLRKLGAAGGFRIRLLARGRRGPAEVGGEEEVAVHRRHAGALGITLGITQGDAAAHGVTGQDDFSFGLPDADFPDDVREVVLVLADVVHVSARAAGGSVPPQIEGDHVGPGGFAEQTRVAVVLEAAGEHAVDEHDRRPRAGLRKLLRGQHGAVAHAEAAGLHFIRLLEADTRRRESPGGDVGRLGERRVAPQDHHEGQREQQAGQAYQDHQGPEEESLE